MADKSEANETELVERPSRATPVESAEPVEVPAIMGATFAERAKAREAADRKAMSSSSAENKAASGGETKSTRGRRR